ncbi:MAG: heme o synthase [Anaerolineales bacterium]
MIEGDPANQHDTVLVRPKPRVPSRAPAEGDLRAVNHQGFVSSCRDYLSLTKPRVAVLLLLTALVAMFLAPGGDPSLSRVLLTMLGGYLAAGGAGAVNCYLDRDLDAQMKRTCHRALPSGRLEPANALILGLLLGLLSLLVLWFGTHPLAAILALCAFLHYVLVYTLWLKRRSTRNVVIGGLAGAVPPLVGWAAVTGTLSPAAWVLAAIVYCWTPAHFWALALMRREEYGRAGVPMLPVVRGAETTRRRILAYTALTVLLTALPVITGTLGALYAVAAGGLGALFLGLAVRMRRGGEGPVVRRFYFFTLIYLGALFLAMWIDRLILLR